MGRCTRWPVQTTVGGQEVWVSPYAFEPEAKRGVRDAPWTVSWDKGCGVSCRRRHSVEEVSLQPKEKGSCMHDCLTYICTACICLCW